MTASALTRTEIKFTRKAISWLKGIIEKIVDHSSVPVTAVGGARSFDDLKELSETCGLMGVAAGSLWCFKEPNKAVLLNYPNPRAKTEIFQ